jgi:YcxB-like protein
VAGLLMSHYRMPRYCARVFRQNPAFSGVTRYSWDESVLEASSEIGTARIRWRDYLKCHEDERQFLLYLADNQFQMVPKAWFTDDAQTEEFRRLAAQARLGAVR